MDDNLHSQTHMKCLSTFKSKEFSLFNKMIYLKTKIFAQNLQFKIVKKQILNTNIRS